MVNAVISVFRKIDMHGGDRSVCWEWCGGLGGRDDDKRPYFNLDGEKVLAYRLVFELTFGRRLHADELLRHECDNRICCNPYHVIVGDHQDNMDDMKERDRHGVPATVVKAIRKIVKAGMSHADAAKLYGLGRSTVSDIISGETHGHVND